ncbi:hypothetical protein [Paenibacillus radicis (ex Xue et al. 2023)]|uniref:SLH domain-containing protein n=1 Tax=Paenibacillus radicis (ex Xue et al. 2023) TaxID=2972489 RepID=A0ABT1YJ50_9BACL|nr:hypothetical protein [Paenibacillus radicis (ex Xue et al. 2023)]MCR8632750.1 hypothetical protein [Paenibacillus radicis (ex Xue et al. 2023)]
MSAYASKAVAEAVCKGLIHSKTETAFAPQEAAVLIKQAMQYLKLIN